MTSILLGTLSYSDIISKNSLNNIYNSNIQDKMRTIEYNQALQNNINPEYLKQFDELKFDNPSPPVGVNQYHKGLNHTLQRNLDFQNGYSDFQNNEMHYDVVTKDSFTHNNMVPNTSRRDFNINSDRCQRKLETFTGRFENYTPKKEKVPLFEPMSDLTWTNGMPAITDKIQTRYLPSNKNNFGNLPFENKVRVRPGLGDDVQQGNYAVYRINPRNIDALRSDINQKETYENKPLETIKKGEYRGPDFNLTKYKLPDFRIQDFTDLVASRSVVEGAKQTGEYTDMTTQRNEDQHYNPGPAINRNKGDGPDKKKTRFEPAKRESYFNDSTHAVNNVNSRPVMTNVKSYTNYDNQRLTTNYEYEAPLNNSNNGNYVIDYKDVPLTTLRELMINNDNQIGIIGNQEAKSYVFSNDMVLPVTHRQTMSENNPVLGASANVKSVKAFNPNDIAKLTHRQDTSHNMAINATSQDKSNRVYYNDQAKITIKETTTFATPEQNIKAEISSLYASLQDKAKPTIKQLTEIKEYISNVNSVNGEITYTSLQDKAKPTIKQLTEIKEYISNVNSVNGEITYTSLQDKAKPTIKQLTEIKEYISNVNSVNGEITYTGLQDNAKPTLRQFTEITQHIGHANTNVDSTYVNNKDPAKPTLRQYTELTKHIGSINAVNDEASYLKNNDIAKTTIKETTLSATPAGRIYKGELGNYAKDMTDIARPTLKQTTLLTDYTGGLSYDVNKPISHEASNNMTIDERREITTYNRPSNGRADLNGPYIDRENVKLNDPLLYSYVSHPKKSLDHSVMPTTTNETINKVYLISKPVIETSNYYVNPYFINTLKDNPLVNDLYHQKNTL